MGVGFTIKLKDTGEPKQVLEKGVTVISEEIGKEELLLALKDVMFPLPVAGNPIPILLFVQLNTVPAMGEPVKLIGSVLLSPQTTILLIGSSLGIGSTTIWKRAGSPEQPLLKGVTTN
jgi:hypothetical protein